MAEVGGIRGVDETTHTASTIADTAFVPDGRPDHLPDLTPTELRDAAGQVNPDDIGIAHIDTDGPFVRVETADGGTHVFRPEVGHRMPHVAETTVRAGTTADPHVTRVNDRVAADQLARVWVHEISEAVQAHRAAEPQTPLRRAIDRLSSLLGHGPTVEPDPHTIARLDERRYLVRELTEATNPAEQARLRQDVLGLDRELAGTGYPTHDLARLPEPGTTIQRALLGDDGPSFPVADQPIPEAVPRDPDGVFRDLHAECLDIAAEQRHLADSLRGDGKYWFAKVYHHVTMFELRMIDGGGYTYPIMKLQEVVAFHATYRTNMDAWLGGRFGDVEPNWAAAFDAAESAAGGRHLLPTLKVLEALLPSMQAHIRFDLPRAIADVYERHYAHTGLDLGTFARDLDRMGPVFDQASAALRPEIAAETFPGDPGQYGFAQRYGMRFVFDVPQERLHAWEKAEQIVVAHAEGIHDQAGVQRRVEDYLRTAHPLSGRDFNIGGERVTGYDWNNQPVTASEVPQSQFHGYGREVPDPVTVERLARQAVGDAPVDVRAVPANALPDRAVARTVPDGDGYRIEISDRATDANIPRAVAHELAELHAIREREANGLDLSPEDALRPGRFADGATLSPHDRGRLAEVDVLSRMLDDAAHRAHAQAELLALRDHLGLRPDDPGAAGRLRLIEGGLGGDAHHGFERAMDAANQHAVLGDLSPAHVDRLGDHVIEVIGLAHTDVEVALVRLPTGEHVVRVFSDEAFLRSVREWHPETHGGRPFPRQGSLPEALAMDGLPGLRDWVTGDLARLLPGEAGARVETYLSRDATATHGPTVGDVWLHRAAETVGDAPTGHPETGPGGVPLHVDDEGRVLPVDRSGHVLRDQEVNFIGADQPVAPFDRAAIDLWARDEVPLGMPPRWWPEWQATLRDALVADGIDPATVDVRMKGSAAEFFSGPRKSMPTMDSLAADLAAGRITPDVYATAIERLAEMLDGAEGDLPVARPFDAMYRLGLDHERSDYDINLSSDDMFRSALAEWNETRHGGTAADGSPKVPIKPAERNHGYLDKDLVNDAFPNLAAWAERWTERLDRPMSYAVFLSRGPDDTMLRAGHAGVSVHYRETDWVIKRAEEP